MKHILLIALFTLASCVSEERAASPAYGVVQVEIAHRPATRAGDDEVMNTIRLIVFTDLDATPHAEVNRLYDASEFTVVGDPGKVKFVLKVSRKKREKLVVAVINEPLSLTSALDAVATPTDLDGVEFDMADFLTENHQALLTGAAIPMTGALWTDRLFRTEDEAGRKGNILRLNTQRAVARVDVYLVKGTDVDPALKMAARSTVILSNTCTKGNLFYHFSANGTIGSIPTVPSADPSVFKGKSWSYTGPVPILIDEDNAVCSFYTPERTHTADRLTLTIGLLTEDGAPRRGTLEMVKAKDKNGVEHSVDNVLRNHIYKVTATIGANEITATINDWTDKDLTTEF